jgi:hypothetical protein
MRQLRRQTCPRRVACLPARRDLLGMRVRHARKHAHAKGGVGMPPGEGARPKNDTIPMTPKIGGEGRRRAVR